MEKERYITILKMIILALEECKFEPYNIPEGHTPFITMIKQYGKKHLITDKELFYVLQTPLIDSSIFKDMVINEYLLFLK